LKKEGFMFLAAGENGRQVLKDFNELLKFEEEGSKDTSLNDSAECISTMQMNLDKIIFTYLKRMNMFSYRISGKNKLLMLIDRDDLLCDSIEWANLNSTWEWAMLDAGKEGVSVRFYADAKEKERFVKSAKRKFFGKSVLELVWVYMKENDSLWKCDLKWTDNE
jgi:hypothetical protein